MVNCHPVLLQQYCEEKGIRCPQLELYINSREGTLEQVMEVDGCDRDDAKRKFLPWMYGGCPATKSKPLKEFGQEMKMIIDAVYRMADEHFIEAAKQSQKQKQKEENNMAKKEGREPKTLRLNLGGRTMSQMLNDIENDCLMAMVNACNKPDINANVTALCFDGFLVDNKWGEDVEQVNDVLRRLEEECFKATGYKVTLLVKEMDRAIDIEQGLDLESSGSLDYSNIDFSLPHNQRFLTNLANALPKPLTRDRISALRRVGLQQKPIHVTDENWETDQGILTLHDLRLALFSHFGYDKHQHWCRENVLIVDQTEALLLNDVAGLSELISQLLKGRCKVTQDLKSAALWNGEVRLWMRVKKIDALTLEICKELIPIVERYVDLANSVLASNHHSFCVPEQTKFRNLQNRRGDPMAVSKCDRLQSLLDRVRNGAAVNQVIRQVVLPLRDDGFFDNLDRSPDTLPITDGRVVILRTAEVRQRTVDDRWSFELQWNFSRDSYEYIPPPYNNDQASVKPAQGTNPLNSDNDVAPIERINPEDIIDIELRHFAIHYPNGFMFFVRICQNNNEYVKSFLQIIGYLISGETCRREMYVWYGGGRNGKSTLMTILKAVLGPLMGTAHPSLLSYEPKDPNAHTAAYNKIINAHLVNTSEGSDDTVLTAAVVKRNTGDDMISNRGPHQTEGKDYQPMFKVVYVTNPRPRCDTTDPVIDRVVLIPFVVQFAQNQQNTEYCARLSTIHHNEFASMCVDAARLFYRNTQFTFCKKLIDAKADYVANLSSVNVFLKECQRDDPNTNTPRAELYQWYLLWFEHIQNQFDDKQKVGKNKFGQEVKTQVLEGQIGSQSIRVYKHVGPSELMMEMNEEKRKVVTEFRSRNSMDSKK